MSCDIKERTNLHHYIVIKVCCCSRVAQCFHVDCCWSQFQLITVWMKAYHLLNASIWYAFHIKLPYLKSSSRCWRSRAISKSNLSWLRCWPCGAALCWLIWFENWSLSRYRFRRISRSCSSWNWSGFSFFCDWCFNSCAWLWLRCSFVYSRWFWLCNRSCRLSKIRTLEWESANDERPIQ